MPSRRIIVHVLYDLNVVSGSDYKNKRGATWPCPSGSFQKLLLFCQQRHSIWSLLCNNTTTPYQNAAKDSGKETSPIS